MNNLKSYTEYAVTTPTTDFVIGFDFNYGTDAVNITVDDVPATEAGYTVIYLNSTTMRLNPAVPSGVVRLQRETNIDVPDNKFTAGAKFITRNMDENFTQIRHSQQEVRDGFEKLSEDTYEIIDTLQVVGQAAQDAADAAEQAAQTANNAASQVNDKVSKSATLPMYLTVADGIDPVTGVADGAYFNVRSLSDDSYVDEYQNVGGVAIATGKSYLSALGVQQQEKPASTIKDASGEWQQEINDFTKKKLNGVVSIYEVMTFVEYSTYDPNNYEGFDATAIVQRAIDKAYAESKEIFVPSMFAIRSGSLVLPNYVSFVGQEFGRSNTRYKSGFAAYVDKLFVANPTNDTFGVFKRVRLYSRNMVYYSKLGNGSICFYDMAIYNADVYRNFIFNFGIVINGIVASSSNIYNNFIMQVRDRVLSVKGLTGRNVATTSALIDSNIYRNYINAIGNAEVIGFDLGTGSHFSIDHNFIDFFYKGVISSNTSGGSINDNIFDVCFRGVENLNSNTTNLSGNKFLKNSKSYADSFISLTGSANEVEVRTTDWEGVKIRFGQSITIQGNTGYSDCLINISGYSLKKIKTSGNTNHNDVGDLIRLTRSFGGSLAGDGDGLDLQELKFRTVTSLPVVVITAGGASTTTYTGDIVKFNDQHLINDGVSWRGLDGLGIIYKQDRSITVPALAPNALHKSANLTLLGSALGADIRVSPRVIIDGVQHWAVVTGANTYVIYSKNNGDVATVSTSVSFNVTVKNF